MLYNTDYTTADYDLFLAMNVDGGTCWDKVMLTLSGTLMWLPLYALILYLVYRRSGLKSMLIFLAAVGAAIALSDIIAGVFKANGILGTLLPEFTPRPRPMFNAALEGLSISPDSLRTLRYEMLPAGSVVHVPVKAVGGLYGTVSAHAATIAALALLSASVIRRGWFTVLMLFATIVICYSRIYLGKHYPLDLLWGILTGLAVGYAMLLAYRKLSRHNR